MDFGLKQVLDLFTQTAAEICGGQQFDMEFESRMDVSLFYKERIRSYVSERSGRGRSDV